MSYLLHDVLSDAVRKYPLKQAIITEDGDTISYGTLNELSNKYANTIQSIKSDIIENPYVGIISDVKIDSIACILAVLKIGCAYVPLDELSPTERLKHIIQNTGLDVIAVESRYYEKYQDLFNMCGVSNVILLDDDIDINKTVKITCHQKVKESSIEFKEINQVSDSLAYILHSSGSTGIPKGIMLTHRNARTFVDWMHKEFKITGEDIVISRAPFKFDLSVFDIFNTFKAGATLVCYNWAKKRDGNQKHLDYVKLMEKEKVTILYTTPSTFISLLNRGELEIAKLNLRLIMYAGEPFAVAQLRRLAQALPLVKIANIYGPTETNIITYFWVDRIPENDNESIPLGSVVDDTEIIVVSPDNPTKICDPDELGELWCRGGTVTIGYLGMPDKTNECLVLSPFHKYPVYFWRTGDFGFKDETECLHYRGRRDHMIKVKGFRIELGEVENAVAGFNEIDEFVVIAKPDDKYGNRLYCYFSILNNRKVESSELSCFVQSKLPEYMVPYEFIQLDVLPKTSSGKIDRVLLTTKDI